ncbi:MAG: FAD:protein FMN transferase, partial [Anaerovoracaceae bacterium]
TVDYRNIEIEDSILKFKNAKTQIDLGGIAKGFAADEMKKYLMSKNVEVAIINLGGNVITIGNKADGTPWNVGVDDGRAKLKDPASTELVGQVQRKGSFAVSTAGIYQRYQIKNDKLYHHILDTKTGFPAETDLISASVVSEIATNGDAFSTILLIKGFDSAKDFAKKNNINTILVRNDGEIAVIGDIEFVKE